MKKTVLITGAAGFLGSQLVEKFSHENYEIIILVRSTSNLWRIDTHLENIIIYFSDKCELAHIFQNHQIDFVAHAATLYGDNGEKIVEIVNSNTLLPLALINLAIEHNVKAFINTDTFYNRKMQLPLRLNYYVLSKKHFIEYAQLMTTTSSLKFFNLIIENVYGPKENNKRFVPFIISKLMNNATEINLTKGEQKRDFIYVKDVAGFYFYLFDNISDIKSNINSFLGTGLPVSIKEVVQCLKAETNSDVLLNFGALPYRENEVMSSSVDIFQLKELGWEPQYTLQEGIKETMNYYRNNLERLLKNVTKT